MNSYGTKTLSQRRPFWLPAANYYVLTAVFSAGLFVLVWGLLHEEGDESLPWMAGGISACVTVLVAVFLREFILRRARDRFLADQRRLDRSIKSAAMHSSTHENNKLTLEKNSELLHEIRVKSDAAKILGKLSDGHREVFEMCARYLAVNGRELTRVNPGSPRLAALLKGKDIAENFHKFHLLQWAEIEARNLTSEARSRSKVSDKIESAQKALSVVDSALKFYPNELNLRDSVEALTEFIASIKMSDWIDRAERAEFKKNYKHAKKLYMDALFFLERDNANLENRDLAAEKIRTEIERIENLQAEFRS